MVLKLHFGEEGTNSFVRPDHLRLICAEIAKKGSVPFHRAHNIAGGKGTRSRYPV